MSVIALGAVFKLRLKNPGAKFVLISLANYSDTEGGCWPSVALIAEMTGFNESTVHVHLGFLEREGFITRGKRRSDDGKFFSNYYKLNLLRIQETVKSPARDSRDGPSPDSANSPSPDSRANPVEDSSKESEPKIYGSSGLIQEGKPKDKYEDQIQEIFAYWKKVLNHPRAIMDKNDDRWKKIRKWLEKKRSVDELKQVIDGCFKSDFHMGRDGGARFDAIATIFKNTDVIEGHIARSKQNPNGFIHNVVAGQTYPGQGFRH